MEGVSDDTVFVDEIGHTRYSQAKPASNIVKAGNLLVGIGQEGEG